MSVSIEFVGGPADGRLQVIEGDPMNPPPSVELLQAPEIDWDSEEPILPIKLRYLREVNPREGGPAWLYRFDASTA